MQEGRSHGMGRWFLAAILAALPGARSAGRPEPFESAWPEGLERVWVGPAYWANRLQDWRIAGGRLECTTGGPDRNVHVLTRELAARRGDLRMRVLVGRLDAEAWATAAGWVGFRAGARGRYGEYRHNAIYGKGLDAGLTTEGGLFIGKPGKRPKAKADIPDPVELRFAAEPGVGGYRIALSAHDPRTGETLRRIVREKVPGEVLAGNLALVCHTARTKDKGKRAAVRCWFRGWRIEGSKVEAHEERAFGPILFAMYTLSRGVLKLTAQMPPIGPRDAQAVRLEIREPGGAWRAIGRARIAPLARTATFRTARWDASRDVPYRLVYALAGPDGTSDRSWYGTIRRDPIGRDVIVVAGFTGNNDLGFPNEDVVRHVGAHDPDLLVFTGDQIYERVAGYGVQRSPLPMACLDYLRKWYLFGWSFGPLLRDRPTVCLPDDHDVYHGNIWGAGGRHADRIEDGGYLMPPEWVNMVQRTQTSHMPDPYDPRPVEQGIGVYYGALQWGGVSFAIIEDRKFKSSPTVMLPEAKVVNGWARNPKWNAREEADAPGAKLLGERQLAFLRDWAADWSHGAWMKVVLSQTIFSNVATLPAKAASDGIVPRMRIPKPGEYPAGDRRAADMDSNGWPPGGRNRALRAMRRGFAFHLAGDQHLASLIQYGVEEWRDAAVAFCVPAIANIWPRRWFPPRPGRNRDPGAPKYTGDFEDGFGNKMTVYAVANPRVSGREPSLLHDRSTGYGIVRFRKSRRTITVECWPRYADPRDPSTGGQYPGWPRTFRQRENDGRRPAAYLARIRVRGLIDPVVQVIAEADGGIVYTLRIEGTSFRPWVFEEGTYTVRVGEPDAGATRMLKGLRAGPASEAGEVEVRF